MSISLDTGAWIDLIEVLFPDTSSVSFTEFASADEASRSGAKTRKGVMFLRIFFDSESELL